MTTKDGSSQNRIYVGNLPFSMTEAELMKVFAEHGAVLHTMVAVNKESGKSRGFGFVTFTTKIDADALIAAGTVARRWAGTRHQARAPQGRKTDGAAVSAHGEQDR